jgi:hypothetical protein
VTFEALLALAHRLEGQSREIVTLRMFTVGIDMRGS